MKSHKIQSFLLSIMLIFTCISIYPQRTVISDASEKRDISIPEIRSEFEIPSDVLYFNGHKYKLYDDNSMDWEEAETYCESLGGHLVTITSEEEQSAVFQYLDSFNLKNDVWIGISDSENEGDWSHWITGEEVIYSNWGTGEPDNYDGRGQDYGVISPVHRSGSGFDIQPGQWDDIDNNSNTASGYFICEWDVLENPFFGGNLQCQNECLVYEGADNFIFPIAFAEDNDSLKVYTEGIMWSSEDESIATVSRGAFVLSSSATKYETEEGMYETWKATGLVKVNGISPGITTIIGRAANGDEVTCEVTVVDSPVTEESVGTGGSLTLGEDISGSADEDSGVLEFFPGNWSLKSALFPVEISIKEDPKTHNYTVRGTVGIGKANWLDDDSKWSKYKKNVSDANKYTGRVDCLEKYADAWGVKSMTAVTTDKFNVLPKLSVMGYIENTYDKNWNLISGTGKLAADAKWEGSINWQFITPIGPLYLNLKGSGALSGNLGPKYNYDEKKLEIIDGSLK